MAEGMLATWTEVGPWRIHALAGPAGRRRGPPLVLVHGFGVSSRYWRPLARHLAPHFPVYAPDLPGHGPSTKPSEALDIPGLAAALAGWLDAAGLDRVVIVANSLGCQVAAELAAHHPRRVHAIVMCGPTGDPAARTTATQMLRLLLSAAVESPRLAPLLLGDYARAGVARLRDELRYMLDHRVEELLPRIGAPVLVLRGRWDRVVPRRWAEQVVRLLPRARLEELRAAGHGAHFTRSRGVAERVRRFLEVHRPG